MPPWAPRRPHVVEAPGVARRGSGRRLALSSHGGYWVTSLAAWVGVDSRGPASLYIATDSRISWGNTHSWDSARKTFACHESPDIFGYVGYVFFPALFLPTVIEILSLEEARENNSVTTRQEYLRSIIEHVWSSFPPKERYDLSIVHATRVGEGVRCEFGFQILKLDAKSGTVESERIEIPTSSSHLTFLGSGEGHLKSASAKWAESDSGGTSRAQFSSFCDALKERKDRRSGGAPQLVALHRKNPGITLGVSWDEGFYINGMAIQEGVSVQGISWMNRLFERVGVEHKRLPGAQVHADRR